MKKVTVFLKKKTCNSYIFFITTKPLLTNRDPAFLKQVVSAPMEAVSKVNIK